MTAPFLPDAFTVPAQLTHPKFVARKLTARDVYQDYLAVMSSIELIRRIRGGSWPTPELSFEDDLIDLAWHQREFEHNSSFAYTVLDPAEKTCLGCFYLYPAGFRGPTLPGADVDVSFWVTQVAYEQGLYRELYLALRNWLQSSWPFRQPHWSNQELPQV